MLKVDLRQETRNIENWSPGKSQRQIEMISFFFWGGGGWGSSHTIWEKNKSKSAKTCFGVLSISEIKK